LHAAKGLNGPLRARCSSLGAACFAAFIAIAGLGALKDGLGILLVISLTILGFCPAFIFSWPSFI
jgi:hypothetical protein